MKMVTGSRATPRWPRADAWRRSLSFQAGAAFLLTALVLLLLIVIHEWAAREAALVNAERETANLAHSLTRHAESTIELADSVLLGVTQRLEADGFGEENLAAVRQTMTVQVRELHRLRHVFVYDANGDWLISSLADQPAGLNNSDRGYFQHHRGTTDPGPYIGSPVRSRSGGQWIITITRRLNGPDGEFAGVVLASIEVTYFERYYAAFDIGRNGSIGLISTSGLLLARAPGDSSLIGRDISGDDLFRKRLPQSADGTYRYTSPIDGVARISGYHTSERFPLLVIAAVGRSDALSEWREQALVRGSLAVCVIGLIGLLGWLLMRQARKRQRIEAALAESEKAFRMLTESSSDMVSRIGSDGTRRYVSPASLRLLGWTPAELIGRSAFDGIPADHREAVHAAIARLRAGETDEATVSFPMFRRDDTQIWIESSLRLVHDPATGAADGVVVITRDVTERKREEAALSALATTDALTGLANRRAFDQALTTEWRRAARDRLDLSVLLLDLDRFKQFNDSYGHPAGDDCLRRVAGVIQATIGRPADLAARYGGEELAVLLPGTGAAGARALADRLRSAIAACAIPHHGNPPRAVVTVSIGFANVAWSSEASGDIGPLALVTAADEALYVAKSRGRDRVIDGIPVQAYAS